MIGAPGGAPVRSARHLGKEPVRPIHFDQLLALDEQEARADGAQESPVMGHEDGRGPLLPNTIWQRVVHEIEHHGRSFEDEGTTEEAAKEQYKRIAERRVRLGLVVAEIGNQNEVQVTDEEHQQALIAEVRRFPGQEQQVYDYYRKNPQALASLRAPIFENKVVDHIIELGKVTDKKMTREELAKLIQADEDEVPEEHHH